MFFHLAVILHQFSLTYILAIPDVQSQFFYSRLCPYIRPSRKLNLLTNRPHPQNYVNPSVDGLIFTNTSKDWDFS